MKQANYWTGIACLSIAGCGFGVMGPLVRIVNSAASPFTSTLLRYSLVIAILFSSFFFQKKLKQTILVSRHDALCLWWVMLAGGLAILAFSLSVLLTTISSAVFLFSLYAVFTPLLGAIFLHERPTLLQGLSIIVALVGVELIVAPGNTGNLAGNILAIIGAVASSIQFVGTRQLRTYTASTISFYLALSSAVLSFPLAAIIEWKHAQTFIQVPSPKAYPPFISWPALLLFALVNLLVNWLVSQGFRFVKSSMGSILLLLEPVVGLIMAILFFGEALHFSSALGSILILISGAVSIGIESRNM